MNHPGTLRHSRAHRAVVHRQQSKQIVAYVIEVPMRDAIRSHGTPVAAMRDWVRLPDGARVTHQEMNDFNETYRLRVEAPRNDRITADRCVTVRNLGPVKPKAKP